MQPINRLVVVALASGSFAHAAYANCDRLFDALDKADKQEHVAQYDVDSRDQPLTGKPMTVRIGKVMYDGSPAGNTFEAHQTGGANPLPPAKFNPMTLWIAKSNGLPVYHELNDLGPGGFAWVYGAAVKDPVVKK